MRALGLFSLLMACSPSLTTMQPARTVPAGHVQIAASFQGTPPVGLPGDVLALADEIDELDDRGGRPTRAQLDDWVARASAAIAAPPSIDAQLSLAYGVSQRFELDARIGPAGAAAGFRVQLLRKRPGIYLALGAMVGLQYATPSVERFTNEVAIDSGHRLDVSFPLSFGYSSTYLHVWGGPKLVLTRYGADFRICVDSSRGECRREVEVSAGGRASMIAGQLGIAVGKGRIWLALELTLARAFIVGDAEFGRAASTQTSEFRTQGRVFSPAIGLLTWF